MGHTSHVALYHHALSQVKIKVTSPPNDSEQHVIRTGLCAFQNGMLLIYAIKRNYIYDYYVILVH